MVQLRIKLNRWIAIYILKDGLPLHCRFDSRECWLALVMELFAMTMTWANWFTLGRDVFLIHTQIQEDSRERNSLNAAVISVTWFFCALNSGWDEASHYTAVTHGLSASHRSRPDSSSASGIFQTSVPYRSLMLHNCLEYFTQGMADHVKANQKQTHVSRKLSIKLVDFLLFIYYYTFIYLLLI